MLTGSTEKPSLCRFTVSLAAGKISACWLQLGTDPYAAYARLYRLLLLQFLLHHTNFVVDGRDLGESQEIWQL